MRADVLCQHFELSTQTGSASSGSILNLLKIDPLDSRWSRHSQLARNSLAWLIEIDGFVVTRAASRAAFAGRSVPQGRHPIRSRRRRLVRGRSRAPSIRPLRRSNFACDWDGSPPCPPGS